MPMVARGEGSFEDMLGVKDIRRVGSAVPLNLNGSTHVRSATLLPMDLQLSNEKDMQVTKKDPWSFELILPEGSTEDYKGL